VFFYFKMYMVQDLKENLSKMLLTAWRIFLENCKFALKMKEYCI